MRRKRSFALILAGILLLVGAAGLNAYNVLDAKRAGDVAAEDLKEVVSVIEEAQKESVTYVAAGLEAPQTDAAGNIISLNGLSGKELRTVQAKGNAYVGVVEIPSLSVSLPVLAEWSYSNLKISPCRYAGTPYNGDLVVCAHIYRSHFNGLRWVDMGADVYFTTMDGETFHYVIVSRETLDPNETERLITTNGEWQLTLFTCFVGGATRCVIRCEIVG